MMRSRYGAHGRRLLAAMAVGAGLLLALGGAVQASPGLAAAQSQAQEPAQARSHRIHVVRHGWHAGIVVRVADVPPQAWPARREFADAEYLEVGWGDRAYYQTPDPPLWLGLRALLWPSPGVLHIVAFNGAPERVFPGAEVATLQLTAGGLARLVGAIAASHERGADGAAIAFGPGLYGRSRFYASRQRFHLFHTCNVWTAALLREAGVPLGPLPWPTAQALFSLLRQHDATSSAGLSGATPAGASPGSNSGP